MDSYIPDIPEREWSVIGSFVRTAVRDCAPAGTTATRDLLWACTRFVRWCWRTAGLDLERSLVFHPATVAEFLANGCPDLKPRSVANLRRLLSICADRLLPQHAVRRVDGPGRVDPAAPYSVAEIASLVAWGYGQPSALRRVNARVLMSLGLGAGLTGAEIASTLVADLTVDNCGVLIRVRGERPRVVPVLAVWEQPLIDLVGQELSPESPAFLPHRRRSKNLITGFARRPGQEPGPNSYRMRTTWIVGHLSAAVPLSALMAASGVDTVQGLTRYTAHFAAVDSARVREMLRGSRSHR
ncbi:hypothetical protein [Nocardia sp. SSK8]|uniref:hypothetical protein n=1 Tax=Nocardia sp. SSK8 TaxID=3120154 RepID=UPI00300937F6